PEMVAHLIVIYNTYQNVDEALKQFIKGFFFLYTDKFQSNCFLKQAFNVDCPMVDTYVPLFKELWEKEEMNEKKNWDHFDNSFDMLISFISSNEARNQLALRAMEIFELTFDKEMIAFNLKVITKNLIYVLLSRDEMKELRQRLAQ